MDAFPGTTFYKKTFTSLTLSGQTVGEKEFEDCTFEKCIFIECVFDRCRFTDCNFTGCSVSAAKPFNSQFHNIRFRDSKVMGFDWTKAKSARSLAFERCDISYSNFSFMRLHGLVLTESRAREVSFNSADLTDGIFTKTDFYGAVFSNTNLTGADLRSAYSYGIDITANILKKAKFSLPEAASLLKSLDIVLEG